MIKIIVKVHSLGAISSPKQEKNIFLFLEEQKKYQQSSQNVYNRIFLQANQQTPHLTKKSPFFFVSLFFLSKKN